MRLLTVLFGLFSFFLTIHAFQEPIPEVQAAASSALKHYFPNSRAYDGPTKVAPKPTPIATPKVQAANAGAFWLEQIAHQGISAFGPGGYTVFRNVKDFGAKGMRN